jgi:chemotaxis protein histidine kinase CheA
MDQVIAQIDRARDLVTEVVELAGRLLNLDTDADRVHRDYSMRAFELLTEAEAQGLLATSGARSSMVALEDQIGRLSRLKREASRELDRYSNRG